MPTSNKRGFTLVEISIVIIIIALLTSAIVVGGNVVENSKLQTVMKEIQDHETLIHTFRQKFRYYPGDIPDAETYWGASVTNNGDGNWQIDGSTTTEPLQTWQHLFLADLTIMNLTGLDAGTPDFAIDTNVPSSIYGEQSFYHIEYNEDHFNRDGNALSLATRNSDTEPYGGALPPTSAKKIDIKIDDGVANTGVLYSVTGNDHTTTDCSNVASAGDGSDYNLLNEENSCRLLYWLERK